MKVFEGNYKLGAAASNKHFCCSSLFYTKLGILWRTLICFKANILTNNAMKPNNRDKEGLSCLLRRLPTAAFLSGIPLSQV